jgi:hypothetical protein
MLKVEENAEKLKTETLKVAGGREGSRVQRFKGSKEKS